MNEKTINVMKKVGFKLTVVLLLGAAAYLERKMEAVDAEEEDEKKIIIIRGEVVEED